MVNFLSLSCPELQKLPKLINSFTRKNWKFLFGGEEKQNASEEVKKNLHFIYYMTKVGFLYLNPSKFATGGVLVVSRFS